MFKYLFLIPTLLAIVLSNQLDAANLHEREIMWVAELLHSQSLPEPNYMLKMISDYIEAFNNGDFIYEPEDIDYDDSDIYGHSDGLENDKDNNDLQPDDYEENDENQRSELDVIETLTTLENLALENELDAKTKANLIQILDYLFDGKESFVSMTNGDEGLTNLPAWKHNIFRYLKFYGSKEFGSNQNY